MGIAYFLVMKLAIMPPDPLGGRATFLDAYRGLAPPGENDFIGIAKTVLANPAFTLHSLLDEEKLIYVLQILAPVLFLPLHRWLGLLFLLPGIVFTLLATRSDAANATAPIQLSFQYTAHWTPYVFAATVLGLRRLEEARFEGETFGGLRKRAAMAGLALATLAVSYQFGAVLQRNTARGGFDAYRFRTTAAERERRQARAELIRLVPPRAKIAASERLIPHVSNRPDAYTIHDGLYDAEYILFSFGLPETRGDDRDEVLRALGSREFGVVEVRPPFGLLERGHPTEGNAALRRQILTTGRERR